MDEDTIIAGMMLVGQAFFIAGLIVLAPIWIPSVFVLWVLGTIAKRWG